MKQFKIATGDKARQRLRSSSVPCPSCADTRCNRGALTEGHGWFREGSQPWASGTSKHYSVYRELMRVRLPPLGAAMSKVRRPTPRSHHGGGTT